MDFEIGLFAHIIVWTEYQADVLAKGWRPTLYERLREIIHDTGCTCLALNGTANHVHLLISFTVDTVMDTLIEDAKKKSAEWINAQDSSSPDFRWADGYAAFSVSESDLPELKTYISRQSRHHEVVSFRDELMGNLTDHEIEFDEQELFPEHPAGA